MKKIIYLGLAAVFCLYSCKDEPQASFEASSTSIAPGESVEFTNNSTESVRYEWNFGDGHSTDEINPVHTYEKSGEYTVTLTAYSKKDKASSEATQTISVSTTKAEDLIDGAWTYDTLMMHRINITINPFLSDTVVNPGGNAILDFKSGNHYVFDVQDTTAPDQTGEWYLLENNEIRIEGRLLLNHASRPFSIKKMTGSKLRLYRRKYTPDTTKYDEWILVFSR